LFGRFWYSFELGHELEPGAHVFSYAS